MAFWRKDKKREKNERQEREVARRLKESQAEPRSSADGEQSSTSLSHNNRNR